MTDAITTHLVPGEPPIAVDEAGGGGAVLVFLHGIGGNRRSWRHQLAHFGATHRALAPDTRGYGASGDDRGPFRFADVCADLVRVLDWAGAARACLVGHSMGGRTALDFFARHPDRVAALVLADTSGGTPESRDPARIEAFLAARRRPLLTEGKTPADLAPGLARQLAGPGASPSVLAEIADAIAALRTDPYLRTLEGVARHHEFPPWEQIAVPALVLTGAHDAIATPAMARAVADAIPGARFVLVENAGHCTQIEQPGRFNEALAQFLRTLP